MSGRNAIVLEIAALTDLGRTRDHNEDTYLVADLTRGTTDVLTSSRAELGPKGSLFLVADGMGGAAAGELASALAADTIFETLRASWTSEGAAEPDAFARQIKAAVEAANDRIHRYAAEHQESRGMGTTATVVGVLGNRLHLAQVGDSRAYLVRDGRAVQLTKDQSLIQRLIDAGELTEDQAAQSERRNIILQALGPDARIRVDVTYQDIASGDILILCSDGLSGQVTRDEIGRLAAETPVLADLPGQLVALANERGGPDNITVVAVRFEGAGLPAPAAADDLGYHAHPSIDSSDEQPVQILATPVNTDAVIATDEEETPPIRRTRRTGSPAMMAAIGVAILLGLLAIFLLVA
ncbi:MAG: serine/threonine-protein phosphatase [Gemmatimonadales bacterium]|nr:serine/threonine-protein phosphatase [Gemmatimonadales bacterium]